VCEFSGIEVDDGGPSLFAQSSRRNIQVWSMAELRSGREKEHEEGKQGAEFSAFPYTPYAEQLRYMHEAYASAKVHNSDPVSLTAYRLLAHALPSALQDGNVAVLESPTGTGKTLSILVGVLSWLEEHIDSGLGSASSDPSGAFNFFRNATALSRHRSPHR
jgi:hypothetical protein